MHNFLSWALAVLTLAIIAMVIHQEYQDVPKSKPTQGTYIEAPQQ